MRGGALTVRDYEIVRVRSDEGRRSRLIVVSVSLEDPYTWDEIASFVDSEHGRFQALDYVRDAQHRQQVLEEEVFGD